MYATSNLPHEDLRKDYTAQHGINFATMAGDTGPNGEPGPNDAYESNIPYVSGKKSYISTHGTAVAGFIAASVDNNKGIAGVADGVEIYPYRMFNQAGASLYTILYGLEYLIENDELPDVINMSVGTERDEFVSTHLGDLFDKAAAMGTIVVAAASNDGGGLHSFDFLSYPASFDSVISVANSTQTGALSGSSQENAKVDVTAPGTSVYSLKPDGTAGNVGGGTSFASPLVAGIAAALKQKDPSIDVYAFRDLIKKTSRKIWVAPAFTYSNGHSESYGYGLIDAEAMLSYLEQPEDLYRIKYDLNGGRLDKSCDAVSFATAGDFTSKIALPGNSGVKPKKDGYVFSGWTVNGGTTTTSELTAAHIPSNKLTPVTVTAKWTADTVLKASDFVISFDKAVEIEDAQYYDGASGYAKSIVSLSALAGVQTAAGDPVVSVEINSLDYIENSGEGCYYVEFTTSKGAFATVVMTVYKGAGRAAALKATTFNLSSDTGTAVAGASVIANNFAVKLSQIKGGTNASILANAKSYTWQREGTIIKNRKEGAVTVDGFSEITTGGPHTVYFRSASEPGAVIARTVEVTDDLPPVTPPSSCVVSYYDEHGAFILPATVSYGDFFYDRVYDIPGYDRLGWNTKPDGTGIWYTSVTRVTSDVNVYSVWTPKLYTISFNASGATGGNPASVSVHFKKTIPTLPTPVRKGYKFEGWYENGSGAKLAAGSAYTYAHNITVTAKWTKKVIQVKSFTVKGVPRSHVLKKGKTAYLKVKISPANATVTKIVFKSSKPSVLSVNKKGKLKAVKKGKATITVKVGNKSQKIKIQVK
jgi:uncharacterized repeat protein (TIGR02543 family)